MYREKIIGFDAREMWRSPDELWLPERRIAFLLDKSVSKPLSVDPGVWEPVWDAQDTPQLPEWVGPRGGWDKLSRLEQFLASGHYLAPYWVIAVTQLFDTSDTEMMEEYASYGITPSSVDKDWAFIGYDVADYFQTSFLTNAGFEDDEPVVSNADRWIERLNEHHLLRSRSDALEYVEVAYQRDASHGPFFAYGLHLVRSVEES
jgi:hypothetical protein